MKKVIHFIAYPLGAFPNGVYAAFANVLIPLYLLKFTTSPVVIGSLVTATVFASAIGPLLIGPLTDRVSSSFGKRKVFLIIGIILTAVSLMMIPFLSAIVMVYVGFLLTGFFRSITIAPHMALLVKNSSEKTRVQVSAVSSVFNLGGQVVFTCAMYIFWKSSVTFATFAVTALLFSVPFLISTLLSKDDTSNSRAPSRNLLRSMIQLLHGKNVFIYMMSQLSLWFGVNSIVPFFILFLTTHLLYDQPHALLLYLIIILSTGVCAYPLAKLGQSHGEKKVFIVGLFSFVAVSGLGIVAHYLPFAAVIMLSAFAGAGLASATVYSFSLLTRLVPESHIGRASSLHALVGSGFAPVAGVVSGLLIKHFGFPSMFILLATTTMLSIFLLNRISLKK